MKKKYTCTWWLHCPVVGPIFFRARSIHWERKDHIVFSHHLKRVIILLAFRILNISSTTCTQLKPLFRRFRVRSTNRCLSSPLSSARISSIPYALLSVRSTCFQVSSGLLLPCLLWTLNLWIALTRSSSPCLIIWPNNRSQFSSPRLRVQFPNLPKFEIPSRMTSPLSKYDTTNFGTWKVSLKCQIK